MCYIIKLLKECFIASLQSSKNSLKAHIRKNVLIKKFFFISYRFTFVLWNKKKTFSILFYTLRTYHCLSKYELLQTFLALLTQMCVPITLNPHPSVHNEHFYTCLNQLFFPRLPWLVWYREHLELFGVWRHMSV